MKSNNLKICSKEGHNSMEATHLCIFKKCSLQYRWCCANCIADHNHNHQYIMPWKEMIAFRRQDLIKLQSDSQKDHEKSWDQILLKGLEQCNQMAKLIKKYEMFLEEHYQKIVDEKASLQNTISDLQEESFILLDQKRLDETLYINFDHLIAYQQYNFKPLLNLNSQIQQIEVTINGQFNTLKSKVSTDLKQRQYSISQIDFTKYGFYACSISNNEQYLAYGGCDRKLKVYDIKNDKITKEKKVRTFINVCQFSSDSSLLFVGCIAGFFYCYDVKKDFKQIYGQQIYKVYGVTNIKAIRSQFVITTSYDRFIKQMDIRNKKQIFKINLNTELIYTIDCSMCMIVGGFQDKSIKLWNYENRKIIINKQNAHPDKILQINFIHNNQYLLALDQKSNLYKWRVDYNNKDLIKIQEIKVPNKIHSFNQINQNQNILLICEKFLYIIDDQEEIINQIEHYSKYIKYDESTRESESRQLDNLNYIHIRSFNKIMLAKALN